MISAIKHRFLRAGRFVTNRDGAAAIEFALIVPILLVAYLGTMELSQGIEINKKLGRVASMVGDLVTQEQELSTTELLEIAKIGNSILLPYARKKARVTITAITISDEASPKATVAWSYKFDGTTGSRPYTKGSAVTVPAKLLNRDTFLVRAVADLDYVPIAAWTIAKDANGVASIKMSETYYLSPRLDDTNCTNC
jgi:Flp pilus assembly protein TadG